MLTNQEVKDIESTIILLTAVFDYANTKGTLYKDTGLTAYEIDQKIVKLNRIYTKTITQKKKASEKANAWNKAHPDKHRKHNKDYAKRKREGGK